MLRIIYKIPKQSVGYLHFRICVFFILKMLFCCYRIVLLVSWYLYCCRVVSTSLKPKLEDLLFSTVRDCLINIFASTLHIESLSSIRNLTTRHTMVAGTHLSWKYICIGAAKCSQCDSHSLTYTRQLNITRRT